MALLSPPHLEDSMATQKGSEPGCGQKSRHLELVHDIGQYLGDMPVSWPCVPGVCLHCVWVYVCASLLALCE